MLLLSFFSWTPCLQTGWIINNNAKYNFDHSEVVIDKTGFKIMISFFYKFPAMYSVPFYPCVPACKIERKQKLKFRKVWHKLKRLYFYGLWTGNETGLSLKNEIAQPGQQFPDSSIHTGIKYFFFLFFTYQSIREGGKNY